LLCCLKTRIPLGGCRIHKGDVAVLSKKLVPLAAGAESVNVHPRTLRRLIAKGELPAYRVGKNIKVDLNDLEAILKPVGGDAA
jgi:excisionase family DNA binding protein